jgi:hypothetical protein
VVIVFAPEGLSGALGRLLRKQRCQPGAAIVDNTSARTAH